jgi:hypothetical protein
MDRVEVSPDEAAAAQAAAQNQQNQGQEPTAERPEWLPEKFATAEAMAQAYKELETKQRSGQAKPPTKVEEGNSETPPSSNTFESLLTEMTEAYGDQDGELTEEQYAKLATSGFSKPFVDSYIKAQVAVQESQTQKIFNIAGGEESYREMAQWAHANLSESEKQAYDVAIADGNESIVKFVVEGLNSRYLAATGKQGQGQGQQTRTGFIQPATTPAAKSGERYASTEEMRKDMARPEYKTDPGFRQKVATKVGNSSLEQ